MQIHPLVTDTATLQSLCERLKAHDTICVDTEFMRENTYYPELCLVQVASSEEAFAFDPLAEGLDMAPFLKLLSDESILKVLHAGGQDIEIFMNLTGKVPFPLFDTQIAAMAMGMGEQVSYANLVAHFTGQQIDKGARFTDWARRPLSDRQIHYAIGDVTYLAQLFPKMLAKLRKTGRGEWLDEEMARISDPSNYVVNPENAWQRLKLPNRKPEVLGRLKALAKWRELEASSKNVPRGRIVKDETLADLAASPPAAQADLARVRGLSPTWASNAIGQRLLDAIAGAVPLPEAEMPARDNRPGLSSDSSLIADLLKLLLKVRAKESGVAPRLIARSEEMEALAGGQREGLAMLSGWRREQFGEDALALVEGRLGFSVSGGRMRMRALQPDQPGAAKALERDEAEAPAPAPAPEPDADAPPARRKGRRTRAPG
ncbi:ribonuclease D [Sandaracinobacter sp. RS1-74]|uniref:ribonuclease D n=1 Tax=Sandaracinobacteroides sayramensis TaxID=2913411 RepID=UPI001EDC3067|nr:ribonuclease D [Sandaracinobacteroides sayramensis]MCG2840996.1 ribonuclease D [Sandaracinobacteroides sayramensis]